MRQKTISNSFSVTPVYDGKNGDNGVDGYNTAVVPLYRRSATALTNSDRPNGTLTYSFTTNQLTGSGFNGWSQSIPAASAGTKLYVTMATARSKDFTDEISANEWSTPVEYVADGMNSATILIYKRSATQPNNSDRPANGVVYTFADGSLSGSLNGWSKTIPATDGNPCWVRQATAVSNTTTDTINSSEWSGDNSGNAIKLIEDGINSAVVPLYRRSATALTDSDRPTGKLTYTFSTGALSGSGFNSWSQSIPAASAGTKLYVIMATARGTTDTDEISANEWSTPVEYVADGMNSAPVVIYKRADSIGSNDKPSNGCTYTFSTGALSGTLNGWSTSIPNSNGEPCWVRHATAVSNTNTDTINASEWSSATKLVENGDNAQYIYLKGSAFNKDSAGTNIVNSEIRVNGGNNLATQSRGLCLVTLNRQTLAVVDSATIYDTYEGTTGKNNLITKLNSLGDNVFVCLVSFDAIGWSDTLISLLQTFGMSDLPYTSANRYPFLFIGHKNLGKGNGITRMNDMAEPAIPVELGVYVANGALSVKDGEDGDDAVTYKISLAGSVFANDPNYSGGKMHVNIKGKVYKVEGGNTTVFTSLTSSMLDLYYIEKDGDVYNFNTGEFSVGSGSNAGTFSTTLFNNQGWSEEEIFLAVLRVGGVEVARESIQIEIYGINGQSIKGDTGKMCYIAGEYDPAFIYRSNSTQTVAVEVPVAGSTETKLYVLKTDSNVDGDGVHHGPSDSAYWEEGLNRYNLLRTKYLFTDFAKLGSGVVSGDWLFSARGTINGTVYNDGNTHGGVAAYMAFNGNDPLGSGIIKVNNVTRTLAYNVSNSGYFGSMTLTQGRDLVIKANGYRNDYSTNKVYLKLYQYKINATTGVGEYILAASLVWDSVTVTEKTLTFTVMESGTYYLRVEHTTSSSSGNGSSKVSNIVATEFGFAPKYAVDLKTGKVYQNDAYINGVVISEDTEYGNKIMFDATTGGLTMIGPKTVNDDDRKPSGDERETLAELHFETDPDTMTRLAYFYLRDGHRKMETQVDPEYGVVCKNTISQNSESRYTSSGLAITVGNRSVNIDDNGITVYVGGTQHTKTWEQILGF